MEIVFFGSGKFAVKSLEALVKSKHNVKLVITQPDKPKGRHLKELPTELKIKAQELGLTVHQPPKPNSQNVREMLKQPEADLFIVISYGHILGEQLLNIPRLYSLNIHGSLLPAYRGAAPINWAIINGEAHTGISIIRMNAEMDEGDILLQKKIDIRKDDNALILEEKMGILASDSLIEAINLIEQGKAQFIKQDSRYASSAPKLKKEDGLIDWHKDAVDIFNKIRGLVPWPTAFTFYKKKLLKIWSADVFDCEKNIGRPGEIIDIDKQGFMVGCGKGVLRIIELQLEGGRRLSANSFICGHKLVIGDKFG